MITLTVNGLEGTSRARHKYKEVIMRAQAISGPILAWLSRENHCFCSTNIQKYSLLFSLKMLLLFYFNTNIYISQGQAQGERLSERKKVNEKLIFASAMENLCCSVQ